jgi:hypothetical protein
VYDSEMVERFVVVVPRFHRYLVGFLGCSGFDF